jgi:hypothetical protein
MLYPDSTDFVGRAFRGLHGEKVWRGDHQFLPGYPYLIYWLSRIFPWPINTPLRVVQHGCLIVSHLCAYGIVRTLTESRTFAIVVALSGLVDLSYVVLGNQLITESLYSAAVSVTALLLCMYAVRPRLRLLWLVGLTIGLASLVRATGVYMAWIPVLVVAVKVWQARGNRHLPRARLQLLTLAGCLGLIVICVAPVLYYNRTRMHYWGMTHYLGINLYARVVDYDGVYDPEGPAQKQILSLWEKRKARENPVVDQVAGPPDAKPAWRYHWSCMHLLLEDGALNWCQADDLMKQAALEGIRQDRLGYVLGTASNIVEVLGADYRLYVYTRQLPPPDDYPQEFFSSNQPPTFSPYEFNKASIRTSECSRCYSMFDCYEPFGPPGIASVWQHAIAIWEGDYFGLTYLHRLRIIAWLTISGALISLLLKPRIAWWTLFCILALHIGGAMAVEWPLPRYRLPLDPLLAVYCWLCFVCISRGIFNMLRRAELKPECREHESERRLERAA